MKEILRNTFAALAGALLGLLCISLIQGLTAQRYPLPAGFDPGDKAAMGEFLRALPIAAKLLILSGYFVGVTLGAWVAHRLSFAHGARQAFLVTALFAVASVMNLLSFPHPVWFWAANLTAVLGGGWLAVRLQPAEGRADP